MELKPGFYKTRDGDCAAVLFRHEYIFAEQEFVSLFGMVSRGNIWRSSEWNRSGAVWSNGPQPDDLIVEWPEHETVPPGLPKIIFDPELAKIYSAPKMFDDEYWRRLRIELAIKKFETSDEHYEKILNTVDALIEKFKERT